MWCISPLKLHAQVKSAASHTEEKLKATLLELMSRCKLSSLPREVRDRKHGHQQETLFKIFIKNESPLCSAPTVTTRHPDTRGNDGGTHTCLRKGTLEV